MAESNHQDEEQGEEHLQSEESEEEIENSDMADEEPSQRKRKKVFEIQRTKRFKPSIEAAGAIKSVELENFMCHSKLKVSFNTKLNFVIGHNGSGKSAILTAILICLGGRARFTNRGDNLKSFIKEGTSYSSITVRIYNSGPDAYKHEIYGDFIEIVRRFTREGTSGYKIKSSSGKTISTKKDDLEEICDGLLIKVDNPLTVLTQDTARQFLASSSPVDLYKFFAKGTSLARLSDEYNLLSDQIDILESILVPQKDDLIGMKKDVKKWEEKWKAIQHATEMEDRLTELRNEFGWAQVEDAENELEDYENGRKKLKRKLEKQEEFMQEYSTRIKDIDTSVQKITLQKDSTALTIVPLRTRCNQLRSDLQSSKSNIREVEMQSRDIQVELNNVQSNSTKIQDRVQEIHDKRNNSGK